MHFSLKNVFIFWIKLSNGVVFWDREATLIKMINLDEWEDEVLHWESEFDVIMKRMEMDEWNKKIFVWNK